MKVAAYVKNNTLSNLPKFLFVMESETAYLIAKNQCTTKDSWISQDRNEQIEALISSKNKLLICYQLQMATYILNFYGKRAFCCLRFFQAQTFALTLPKFFDNFLRSWSRLIKLSRVLQQIMRIPENWIQQWLHHSSGSMEYQYVTRLIRGNEVI